ncbi:MAG: BamA/TamA family outer membrane protein [Bacteroidales bacterium]|nr:BamA/TamA family outer membrane protein [Bacteroidales bacterium]
MMKIFSTLIFIFLLCTEGIVARTNLLVPKDTIPLKDTSKNFIVALPILFFGEETNWGMGITSGYYFTSQGSTKASNIQGTLIYTLKNQVSLTLLPKFYTEDRDFYYSGHIKANYYPDKFFGIGRNTPDSLEENYISKDASLLFQRQRVMFDVIMAGIQAQFGYYQTSDFKNDGELINKTIAGTKTFFSSGLGFLLTWDNRDNLFYPTRGEFYKLSLLINSKIFGSQMKYSRLTLDFRNYYPIVYSHFVSLQIYGDITWGNTPFQLLPSMGGNEILRGYYKGRYRDNNLLAIQAEYRFPIYKWLKGSMFYSAGDVANEIDDFDLKKFKYTYGLGLRARVNPANVHIRFDVGFTQENKPALYFTASEAF